MEDKSAAAQELTGEELEQVERWQHLLEGLPAEGPPTPTGGDPELARLGGDHGLRLHPEVLRGCLSCGQLGADLGIPFDRCFQFRFQLVAPGCG